MENCTLRADAVSASLSDAVYACGVYEGLSVCVCAHVYMCVLSAAVEMMDGGEGCVCIYGVHLIKGEWKLLCGANKCDGHSLTTLETENRKHPS